MSNINVALTASSYVEIVDTEWVAKYKLLNVPICVADMCIGAFGFTPSESERTFHQWAELCKDMAKIVCINSNKRQVLIGDENGWLVEYEAGPGIYPDEFFKRWNEIHVLHFEFTILDFKNEPLFCLKGLWDIDSWTRLDIFTTPSCTILTQRERDNYAKFN